MSDLDARIAAGSERFLSISQDLMTEGAAVLHRLKEERKRLEQKLQEEREIKQEMVQQAVPVYLSRLCEGIAQSASVAVRETLRVLGDRVEPNFNPDPDGKLIRSKFRMGIIYAKGVEELDLSGMVGDQVACIKGTADTPLVVRRSHNVLAFSPKVEDTQT